MLKALATVLLVLALAGATAWAISAFGGDGEAPSTYYVSRVDVLPQGVTDAYILQVNDTLLSSFPAVVQEAFLRGVEAGNSTLTIPNAELRAFRDALDAARRDQGKPEAGYYNVRGSILEMSGRTGHG